MKAVSARFGARPDTAADEHSPPHGPSLDAGDPPTTSPPLAGRARLVEAWSQVRFAVLVYLAARAVLLVVAIADTGLQHRSLFSELTNWDGFWYMTLATFGYPTHVAHLQTTLGFFPLYPMLMWLVAHVFSSTYSFAGLLVSGAGGLIAAVLVMRLCTRWWGEQSARRATALFCFFPGSVVFSMVYSEGVLIPLAAGCLLALDQRRWLLAGALAGLATAVGPDALALVPACAVASLLEIRRAGWHSTEARRSLAAPLLCPVGIIAFGIFLWRWAGSPLATFKAQRYGWGEHTDALALLHQAQALAGEISLTHFDAHAVNLNLVAGLAGAVVLVIGIALLLRRDNHSSPAAIVFCLGVAFLAVTSEYTPPNPRLLLTAFPVVVVIAHQLDKRGFRLLLALSTVLLVVMSAITYVGIALRP